MHIELETNLVNLRFKMLIAKLTSTAKAAVSPYFGKNDFAFALA